MIQIKSVIQIIKRLEADGDLRDESEGDEFEIYECAADDELGFYQIACEWLVKKIEKEQLKSLSRLDGWNKANKKIIELQNKLKNK